MSNWIMPIWAAVAVTLLAMLVFNPKETEISDQTDGSREAYLAENVARKDKTAALMEIAPLATLAYGNLLSARLFPCLMQEASQQSSGVPSTKQSEDYIVTELLSRMERQCVVYTQMEKTATHFFSNLIKSREIQDYYVFTLLELADDPYSWLETEIGIFPSLADCQRFERALHDLDVTTRKCQMRTMPSRPPAPPVAN